MISGTPLLFFLQLTLNLGRTIQMIHQNKHMNHFPRIGGWTRAGKLQNHPRDMPIAQR